MTAMKTKPQIDYGDKECKDQFYKDGLPISEVEAFELWEDGTADWTQRAFQTMSERVMS